MPRTTPTTVDELVSQWEPFIVATIYRVTRRRVRPDDVPDLVQAVYARVLETNYLDRSRTLLAERGGHFSTYLWKLVHSVVVNSIRSNSRSATNNALQILERAPEASDDRTITSRHPNLQDGRFEERLFHRSWIAAFEKHLSKQNPTKADDVTIFRLWCETMQAHGRDQNVQLAKRAGVKLHVAAQHVKRLRALVAEFRAVHPNGV